MDPRFALPEAEAGLFRCRQWICLAMGGPDWGDQALHATGEGALRGGNAVPPALSA